MKHLTLLYTTVLFILFAPITVRAEESGVAANQDRDQAALMEMDIDDLRRIKVATVTGASKYEQKVTEAPSSVSIVTADDIKKYGYRTLADILKSVRGFYVTYDRNYSWVGVRGFNRPGDYNGRILLLVDGHRMNDPIYDGLMLGTESNIEVDLIDRIEVIRGPGSALYGNNAFFAVVNIITKRGRDMRGGEVSGEAGSFRTYKGRVAYGNKAENGFEALLSAAAYDSKGQNIYYREFDPSNPGADIRASNNGIAVNADYDRSENAFAQASYRYFTLTGAYMSRTKGIPTASFGVDFNDSRNKTMDERGILSLTYDRPLGARTNVYAQISYDRYAYEGDYIYSGVVNKDFADAEWRGGEVRLTTVLHETHRIIAGAEYQSNVREDLRNYDEEPFTPYLDEQRSSNIYAYYLQDEFSLTEELRINAGLRSDHFKTFGGTTNPRLAVIYTPSGKSAFKLLYGKAFRAPNMYEQYWSSPALSKSNPDIDPEKITTYEVVCERYFGDHFRSTVGAFYYTIDNLISQVLDPADGLLVYKNVEKIEARGGELELENRWANGIEGRFSYTVQKTENTITGQPLSNSPEQMAKLNVLFPVMQKQLFAGIEAQYISERKTLSGGSAGGFTLANLTVFNRLKGDRLELSANVYNVFDKSYGDPGSGEHAQDVIGQDGRNFRVKLTCRF